MSSDPLSGEVLKEQFSKLISQNDTEGVLKLLEEQKLFKGHELVNKNVFLLHEAVYSGSLELVKTFCAIPNVDINQEGSPISIAITTKNEEVVRELLSQGCSIAPITKMTAKLLKNRKIQKIVEKHVVEKVVPQIKSCNIKERYNALIEKDKDLVAMFSKGEEEFISAFYSKKDIKTINNELRQECVRLVYIAQELIAETKNAISLVDSNVLPLEGDHSTFQSILLELLPILKERERFVKVIQKMTEVDLTMKRISREFSFVDLQMEIENVNSKHFCVKQKNDELRVQFENNVVDVDDKIEELRKLTRELLTSIEGVRRQVRYKIRELEVQEKTFQPIFENHDFREDEIRAISQFIVTTINLKKKYLKDRRKEMIRMKRQHDRQITKYFNTTGFLFNRKKVLCYYGEMCDGLKDGMGREYHEDGVALKYYGNFFEDEKHGAGTEYTPDGNLLRKGYWQENTYVGERERNILKLMRK